MSHRSLIGLGAASMAALLFSSPPTEEVDPVRTHDTCDLTFVSPSLGLGAALLSTTSLSAHAQGVTGASLGWMNAVDLAAYLRYTAEASHAAETAKALQEALVYDRDHLTDRLIDKYRKEMYEKAAESSRKSAQAQRALDRVGARMGMQLEAGSYLVSVLISIGNLDTLMGRDDPSQYLTTSTPNDREESPAPDPDPDPNTDPDPTDGDSEGGDEGGSDSFPDAGGSSSGSSGGSSGSGLGMDPNYSFWEQCLDDDCPDEDDPEPSAITHESEGGRMPIDTRDAFLSMVSIMVFEADQEELSYQEFMDGYNRMFGSDADFTVTLSDAYDTYIDQFETMTHRSSIYMADTGRMYMPLGGDQIMVFDGLQSNWAVLQLPQAQADRARFAEYTGLQATGYENFDGDPTTNDIQVDIYMESLEVNNTTQEIFPQLAAGSYDVGGPMEFQLAITAMSFLDGKYSDSVAQGLSTTVLH